MAGESTGEDEGKLTVMDIDRAGGGISKRFGDAPRTRRERHAGVRGRVAEGVGHDEELVANGRDAGKHLPAARMAPTFAEPAVEATGAVFDYRRDALVEVLSGEDGPPLRGGEAGDVAGEAHAAEEGGGERIDKTALGIGRF